jgi:hypothetical protein
MAGAAYGVQQRMREFGIRSAWAPTLTWCAWCCDCMAPLGGLPQGYSGCACGRAIATLLYGVDYRSLIYVVSWGAADGWSIGKTISPPASGKGRSNLALLMNK